MSPKSKGPISKDAARNLDDQPPPTPGGYEHPNDMPGVFENREPAIDKALNRVAALAAALLERVKLLENRLAPVMRHLPESNRATEGFAVSSNTPLAAKLDAIASKLDNALVIANGIKNRLEV
jgi:hypothetical protein